MAAEAPHRTLLTNENFETMEIQGKTDIEKAIFLLREIEAFLSFNIQPPREQLSAMKETIKGFVSNFPHCFECGDTGETNSYTGMTPCKCTKQSKLY